MNLKHILTASLLVTSGLAISNASAITTGTYNLNNHPAGSAETPAFGLRLDGLLGDPTTEYIFDFDHADSNMQMTWDGSTIVIEGTSFGGEYNGVSLDSTAVWDIYFEYSVGVSSPGFEGGLDDIYVDADNENFGTISSSLGSFELEDQRNLNTGISFRVGDLDGSGFRGHDGISGWGWVNYGADCITQDCTYERASDWQFIASPVPVPAAVWLFGSGLLGLVGVARRRS